jgi:poly(A) polymerase
MLLCNADITSKNPKKVARLRSNFELVRQKMVEVQKKDDYRNWKNPICGEYVMEVFNIPPSNVIGQLKDAVKNAILDGEIENSFEAADAYMREKAAGLGLFPVDKK